MNKSEEEIYNQIIENIEYNKRIMIMELFNI